MLPYDDFHCLDGVIRSYGDGELLAGECFDDDVEVGLIVGGRGEGDGVEEVLSVLVCGDQVLGVGEMDLVGFLGGGECVGVEYDLSGADGLEWFDVLCDWRGCELGMGMSIAAYRRIRGFVPQYRSAACCR